MKAEEKEEKQKDKELQEVSTMVPLLPAIVISH